MGSFANFFIIFILLQILTFLIGEYESLTYLVFSLLLTSIITIADYIVHHKIKWDEK